MIKKSCFTDQGTCFADQQSRFTDQQSCFTENNSLYSSCKNNNNNKTNYNKSPNRHLSEHLREDRISKLNDEFLDKWTKTSKNQGRIL